MQPPKWCELPGDHGFDVAVDVRRHHAAANAFDVRITEATVDEFGSVISQVGRTAFGTGPMFYGLQVVTVGILVLAANTAFQDFPRLSAILAANRLMPRQMRNRGDRLVFSNGVMILS